MLFGPYLDPAALAAGAAIAAACAAPSDASDDEAAPGPGPRADRPTIGRRPADPERVRRFRKV
jgi:hypothetical protein